MIVALVVYQYRSRRYPRSGIAYRPVSDLPAATLALAWPQDARSPAVAAFVRAACAVAASAVAAGTGAAGAYARADGLPPAVSAW